MSLKCHKWTPAPQQKASIGIVNLDFWIAAVARRRPCVWNTDFTANGGGVSMAMQLLMVRLIC
jgi:hypothetical protein